MLPTSVNRSSRFLALFIFLAVLALALVTNYPDGPVRFSPIPRPSKRAIAKQAQETSHPTTGTTSKIAKIENPLPLTRPSTGAMAKQVQLTASRPTAGTTSKINQIVSPRTSDDPTITSGRCTSEKKFLVLMWKRNGYSGTDFFSPDFFGADFFRTLRCAADCVVFETTSDHSMLKKADIIVFCGAWFCNGGSTPFRPPKAVYIYSVMESPVHAGRPPKQALSKYNFFWSYKRDLVLSSTYFNTMNLTVDKIVTAAVPFGEREKVHVATLISNCHPPSGRHKFHKKFMEYIETHNYGACYHNKQKPSNNDLLDKVLAKYKFIFAIENSMCTDYVTGKLGRAFRFGIIALVASDNNLPDYAKYTPDDHSVIDVMSFKTVEDVTKRVKEIAGDKQLFESFLSYRSKKPEEWRPMFLQAVRDRTLNSPLCKLTKDFLTEDGRKRLVERKAAIEEKCIRQPSLKRHFKM